MTLNPIPSQGKEMSFMTVPSEVHKLALLTFEQAAEILGTSEQFVYLKRQDDPTFPAVIRLGPKSPRIFLHELLAWIEAQREGTQ